MEALFWILIALVFYTYIGYGILLFVLVMLKRLLGGKKEVSCPSEWPEVTLVIPAYNEADIIKAKANNSLSLDYPKGLLRILFITDGSTDGTNNILDEIDGVEVLHQNVRAGKAAAENRAMRFVRSPIVVFCDANTILNNESIRELVKHYQDPKVGGVSGRKKVLAGAQENAGGAGEGLYWKYESLLKKGDSDFYTEVGAAGELISFRTECVQDLEEDTILDDFVQSLRICEKGYIIKHEPKAVATETASANVGEELKRKVRIAAGGWQSMSRLPGLLNPFKNFTLTFQYVSHRVLRWSVAAMALPIIFVLNILLLFDDADGVYQFIFLLQLLFYSFAIIGWALRDRKVGVKGFYVPYYFTMMNYAVFAGFVRWRQKKQSAAWERARRAESVEN